MSLLYLRIVNARKVYLGGKEGLKKAMIIVLTVSFLGMCLRSGLVGSLYYFFREGERMSIKLLDNYSFDSAPMGGIYPTFEVCNVTGRKVRIYTKADKVADVTGKNSISKEKYASLENEIVTYKDATIWWKFGDKNTFVINVQSSKNAVILEQKKIVFEKTEEDKEAYSATIKGTMNLLDMPMGICAVFFFSAIIFLLKIRGQNE